ncbi:MAG: hypothetical protein LBD14_04265 [Puniceicoccales bacterium]|jgi:hypothetical protein|nr:hypothetical protein [Puniceicoccales bacterium]
MKIQRHLSRAFCGFFLSLFAAISAALTATAAPVGDGVTDDTAAIQEWLDTKTVVYLPPPPKHYLISKALRLRSGQTLRLDPGTIVRLADGANDYMLVNADTETGNARITVSGGIWDGNNAKNQSLKGPRNGRPWRDFYIGCAMVFTNVTRLRVENLTLKDPARFGLQLGACRQFTVEGITFDYNLRNPSMDGVHLQGGCSEGRVANLKGNTSDDMVALNSDDSEYYEITRGPIHDIQIDGLWATDCFRAVRFLTTGTPIRRVSISNIFGSFQRNVVAFTHWKPVPDGNSARVEDITIANIHSAKFTEPTQPTKRLRHNDMRRTFALIGAEGSLSLDNITIHGLNRREWMPKAAPTLRLQRGSVIGTLRLRDVQHVNMADTPLPFFINDASIQRLFLDNVVVREKTAANATSTQPISGKGRIGHTHGEIHVESTDELEQETLRVLNENKAAPTKELRL